MGQFRAAIPSSSARWRGCAISGQGLQRSARCSRRQLARMRSTSLGSVYDNAGLSSAICCKTTSVQQCVDVSHRRGRGRNSLFIKEKGSSGCDAGHHGFYSRYFVIPKRGGGLCPILDLRILNKHLRKYKFKMATFKMLSHFIREKDWFTSVDLEDAYFHIDIYPAHRKFLRFAYQGTAYEFMTVPFGLSLAPRTFCKCIEAALSLLRTAGLRVSAYLDDLLLYSPSRQFKRSSVSVRGAHQVNSQLSIPFPKREQSPIQTMFAPSWSNGLNSLCYSFGTVAKESFRIGQRHTTVVIIQMLDSLTWGTTKFSNFRFN